MNAKIAAVLLLGLLAACVPPPQTPTTAAPPTVAPAPPAAPPIAALPPERIVSIRGANCGHLLSLPDDDRAAAAMFYIGYEASRLRSGTIAVGQIPVIESLAIGYCEQHPEQTVDRAFARAFISARRGS